MLVDGVVLGGASVVDNYETHGSSITHIALVSVSEWIYPHNMLSSTKFDSFFGWSKHTEVLLSAVVYEQGISNNLVTYQMFLYP